MGAAADFNSLTLPGRFEFRFAAVRAVSRDGGTILLTGVQPTIAVERTIEGIRDGRDELLDRALQVVAP